MTAALHPHRFFPDIIASARQANLPGAQVHKVTGASADEYLAEVLSIHQEAA